MYWAALGLVGLLILAGLLQAMEPKRSLPDMSNLIAVSPQFPGQQPLRDGGYEISAERRHQAVAEATRTNRGLPAGFFVTVALMVFLIGRAIRYLLAGE